MLQYAHGSLTFDRCLCFCYRQLIKAIGATTPDERCLIPGRYKALFGKTLVDVMRSECGKKDFGTAVQFLAVDPVEAECMMIDKACKGAGTDELLLSTLICGRTNKEMDILKVSRLL
jgi:hypothetical protein